ncbi:hypothetical protein SAMN05428995_11062, partial [Loktanella sp. DSM 29012]|uniref:LPD7 domain-containing protein n=1 Tax=Loktanella sp. DSM 29012 TaxID=1881056 RepID=UPI0008C982AF
AKLMIALAAAKGWDRCKITGSEAFCQIAVQLAREAGLVVTNAPDAPVDVGEGMPRADARSRLPVIPDTPWQVEVNIDDLQQSARGAAAQFKRRKQALANAQREEAGRLRALLGRSRTPFAQALRQGLQLHHDDERRTLKEQRAVTPEIPIPPLSGLHRRVRAARRWLRDKTSLMSVAHPSQSVLPDHTACRQMWLAIALQERGATGQGDDDSMAELPDKHLRNTRLTATGEVLFAHRDAADNVVGFEVAFESSEADAGTGFAAGGQRTAWILGDAATAQRAVVTNYASEAFQMAQDEDRDDTLYISVGGAIGAHAREILAGLLSDKIVLACSVNDTSDEALLREVQRIAPQAEWMAAASGVAPYRLPETGELPDEEPADYGPDTDHGM